MIRYPIAIFPLILFFPYFIHAQSISIQKAVDLALKQNSDLKMIQTEVDISKSKVLQAGNIPNLSIEGGWSEIPNYVKVPDAGEFELGLVQEFEFPGKRSSRVESAEMQVSKTQLLFQLNQKMVSKDVKLKYFEILLVRKEIENIETLLSSLSSVQSSLISGFQNGKILLTQIQQIKLEIIKTETEKQNLILKEKKLIREFDLLTGRNNSELLLLSDSLNSSQIISNEISAETSISLKIIQMESEQLALNKKTAGLSGMPDFSVGGSFQRRGTPFGQKDNYAGLTVGMSISSLFTDEKKGKTLEADLMVKQNDLKTEKSKLIIESQIRALKEKLSVEKERVQTYRKLVETDSKNMLSTALTYFISGQISFMEMLGIFRSAKEIQESYNHSLYNYHTTLTEMETANEITK